MTISSDREKDLDAHKEEIRTYEDRLENTRQQLLGERNKNLKKTNKEVAEVNNERKVFGWKENLCRKSLQFCNVPGCIRPR